MTLKLLTAAALLVAPGLASAQTTGTPDSQASPPAAPTTGTATQSGSTQSGTAAPSSEAAPAQASQPDQAAQPEQAAPSDAASGGGGGGVAAATAADLSDGAEVRDTQGGLVGTIASSDAEGAVVNTGSVRAKLPLASFGKNSQGLVISMTKSEFEAAAARAQTGPDQTTEAESEDEQ